MTGPAFWSGAAAAAMLGLTQAMTPALGVGPPLVTAEPTLLSGEALDPTSGVALEMGGSGVPIPPESLVQVAFQNYLVPNGYGDYTPQALFTPEGLYPLTGVNVLKFDTSVAQGVTILNDAIKAALDAGHNVVVGGVSQSATIASIEMQDVANGSLGFQPSPGQLAFAMLGDPSNPNGGILERFDLPTPGSHPVIPSLGLTFSGATPADTGFENNIYTLEYDGFADFPRYPLNILSDINAVLGFELVHPLYIRGYVGPGVGLTPDQIQTEAMTLPTTPGYDGGTTYHIIPFTGRLPLDQVIEAIAGKPVADLLEPDLKVLVNLGYGADPSIGWSESPANVPTPIGLFPSIDAHQFAAILQALVSGAQQGVQAFVSDVSDPSSGAPVAVPTALPTVDLTDLPSFLQVADAYSSVLADATATLLPTADLLISLTTTVPAEDISLFGYYLGHGDLLDAVGMPIATDAGLATVAAGEEFAVLATALDHIETALSGLFS
ncbi:PE-PPE domain-containing protein [Mycobacterium sp.]|uniref:PE-PPE domain-containing protein n=1 Tax=Mycobacterium sp. TaxID=1785 RepID=UPI0031D773A1